MSATRDQDKRLCSGQNGGIPTACWVWATCGRGRWNWPFTTFVWPTKEARAAAGVRKTAKSGCAWRPSIHLRHKGVPLQSPGHRGEDTATRKVGIVWVRDWNPPSSAVFAQSEALRLRNGVAIMITHRADQSLHRPRRPGSPAQCVRGSAL